MTPAYVEEWLQRLQRVRSTGTDKWQALCPGHEDKQASLSIALSNDGKILLHCHAGCPTERICAPLNLPLEALFPPKDAPVRVKDARTERRIATTYPYVDEVGTLLFEAVRYEPKGFSQRRPDEAGRWVWNLEGVRRVLYRLPEVLAAVQSGKAVYVCEGEKDADLLRSWGLCATCNPQGAGKWREEYTETLRGAHVVILPDNDEAGRNHAVLVGNALHDAAASVRVVELPALPVKGDVSDWASLGGAKAPLLHLAKAAPLYTPQAVPSTPQVTPEVTIQVNAVPALPKKRRAEVNHWPEPLQPEALYGLAGELVNAIAPHTEADPAALLFQFLIAFGNVIGRGAHFPVEASKHHLNLFGVMVGQSSRGRKGTSADHILRLLHGVDCCWEEDRVQGGLSSGEGLLSAVRDPIEKTEPIKKNGRATGEMQTVTVDGGVEDKRLFVMEGEFANTLRVFQREGNTLSPLIRQAWDKGNLRTMTKSALTATGAHISIVGHITREELLRYLAENEADNGFANRFLWCCVKRSKLLPFGGQIAGVNMAPLLWQLTAAATFAKEVGAMERSEATNAMWAGVYADLTQDSDGLFGKVTSRSEAQVLRLSCLYALLDKSAVVQPAHLVAALAAWQYCEDSARFIFGNSLGDAVADTILKALKQAGEVGMTRSDISALFQRHINKERLLQALEVLQEQKLARQEIVETGGRPSQRWYAAQLDGEDTATADYDEDF